MNRVLGIIYIHKVYKVTYVYIIYIFMLKLDKNRWTLKMNFKIEYHKLRLKKVIN